MIHHSRWIREYIFNSDYNSSLRNQIGTWLIKFLKLFLNNIWILFKGKIDILLFITFLGFPINIKLWLLFLKRLSVKQKKNYVSHK